MEQLKEKQKKKTIAWYYILSYWEILLQKKMLSGQHREQLGQSSIFNVSYSFD